MATKLGRDVTGYIFVNTGSLDPATEITPGGQTVTLQATGQINFRDAVVYDLNTDGAVKSATSGTPAGVAIGPTPPPQYGNNINVSPKVNQSVMVLKTGVHDVVSDAAITRGDALKISATTAGRVITDASPSVTTTLGYALQGAAGAGIVIKADIRCG